MKYTGWDSLDVLFQSVVGLVKGNCSIKFINQSWKGLETNLIHIWNQHQKHVSSRFPPPWDLCFQTSLYRQLLFVDAKAWNPQLPVCGVRLSLLVCLWWCWWAVLVASTAAGSSPTCLTISHRSWRRMEGMKMGAAEHGVAWEQTGEEVARWCFYYQWISVVFFSHAH